MSRSLLLDHVALRVFDRDEALRFLTLLGYKPADSFDLVLEDGSRASCYALRHDTSPEVFVSSGPEDSFIWRWVQKRGGVGAVHHLAYAVDDVAKTMHAWEFLGIEFQSSEPLVCDCETPLTQVFTKPNPATGLIYELIARNGHPGFCETNVKRLMDSSPA
jgi:catechol 2,3-dioxygenase-like lactoylglutathione lyase family enzyme